jgi:hypothetical protein
MPGTKAIIECIEKSLGWKNTIGPNIEVINKL